MEFPENLCTEGTGWSGPKCTDHLLSACGFEGVQFLLAMASWISKAWIEQALMASKEDLLPKITKAQILKIEETSTDSIWIGVISDKKIVCQSTVFTSCC